MNPKRRIYIPLESSSSEKQSDLQQPNSFEKPIPYWQTVGLFEQIELARLSSRLLGNPGETGQLACHIRLPEAYKFIAQTGLKGILQPVIDQDASKGFSAQLGNMNTVTLIVGRFDAEELPILHRDNLESYIQAGQKAREKLITSNQRLVASIARNHSWSGMPLEDKIQEGYSGLITAVDNFKWWLGFQFSTYAKPWIRQTMQRGNRKYQSYLGDKTEGWVLQINEALDRFGNITPAQITARTGLTIKQVEEALILDRRRQKPLELDSPDGGLQLPFLADPRAEDAYSQIESRMTTDAFLQSLEELLSQNRISETAYNIATQRLKGRTFQQIGEHFGFSRKYAHAVFSRIRPRLETTWRRVTKII